jgi:hypothetical protein
MVEAKAHAFSLQLNRGGLADQSCSRWILEESWRKRSWVSPELARFDERLGFVRFISRKITAGFESDPADVSMRWSFRRQLGHNLDDTLVASRLFYVIRGDQCCGSNAHTLAFLIAGVCKVYQSPS